MSLLGIPRNKANQPQFQRYDEQNLSISIDNKKKKVSLSINKS